MSKDQREILNRNYGVIDTADAKDLKEENLSAGEKTTLWRLTKEQVDPHGRQEFRA